MGCYCHCQCWCPCSLCRWHSGAATTAPAALVGVVVFLVAIVTGGGGGGGSAPPPCYHCRPLLRGCWGWIKTIFKKEAGAHWCGPPCHCPTHHCCYCGSCYCCCCCGGGGSYCHCCRCWCGGEDEWEEKKGDEVLTEAADALVITLPAIVVGVGIVIMLTVWLVGNGDGGGDGGDGHCHCCHCCHVVVVVVVVDQVWEPFCVCLGSHGQIQVRVIFIALY